MKTRQKANIEKENPHENEELPPELNHVKEEIERERVHYVTETFEHIGIPSVETYATQHHLLALIRSNNNNGRDNNNNNNQPRKKGRENNMLLSRMKRPLQHFNGFSNPDSNDVTTLPSVKLPFVEQLPQCTTWVFTDRNQLMTESDSVIGNKQIYCVDGEAIEFMRDNKEDGKNKEDEENFEFSEAVDRFIWKIGQEHNLDDLVVQSALSKYLKVDAPHILERYNELELKNEGNVDEDFDLKSLISKFSDNVDKHFCRRCLIFGCRMHENSQLVVKTREKKIILPQFEDVSKPCSEHCYLKVKSVINSDHEVDNDYSISNQKGKKKMVLETNTEDCVMTDTNGDSIEKDMISQTCYNWTLVEKDLYLKGVEIFGKNSCFITRNLLSGLKTCEEVYYYMCEQDHCLMKSLEGNQTAKSQDNQVNIEVPRKKGKLRKSTQCPPALKNIAKGETKILKHYTPCNCESVCGDQCTCLTNENCCEKYCGCSKTCKNRFGGCNCTKGQCINGQCPCFAANRECDPDLCKSCCLSCGDGSFGEISLEQSKCKNMQFLLKKHKRILLGKSDVQGWGAYTRHSVKKNEFIGEYTGELISHVEADERGIVNDQLGSSYLFALNDQLEIDGRRKGNKFRFMNHSSKPNCYAKINIVSGDHRIGFYANKAIEEGEELFFDYGYGPGHAAWSQHDAS